MTAKLAAKAREGRANDDAATSERQGDALGSKVELRCACGRRHVLDVTAPNPDGGDELVALADGFGPIRGSTLQRWAHDGRLRAFRAERSKLVAWLSDIRVAVEAEAVHAGQPAPRDDGAGTDPLLNDPDIEVDEPSARR